MDEETRALFKEAQKGSKEALEELTVKNVKMIQEIANQFKHTKHDPEDLFQLASIGFIRAVQKFDVERGLAFSTYAYPVIRSEIFKFLRTDGMIRTPRAIQEVQRLLKKHDCYDKTPEEISEIIEIENIELIKDSLEHLHKGKVLSLSGIMFSSSGGDNDITLEEMVVGEDSSFWDDNIALKEAMKKLDEGEKRLVHMRYKLEMPQGEVARSLGVSQTQVSRLERKLMGKLKVYMGLATELPDVDKKPPKDLRGKLGKGHKGSTGNREEALRLLKTSSLSYQDISEMTGVPYGSLAKLGKTHRPQFIKDIISKRPTKVKGELNVFEA